MSRRPRNVGVDGEKLDMKILKRLAKTVLAVYKREYIIIIVCIALTSLASVMSSVFMKTLIDDTILPLVNGSNDFEPLIRMLLTMAVVFAVGIIASYQSQKRLVFVSQGIMEKLRVDVFTHMERLPLAYFDTHAHGDVMSIYTNDTDTMRQVLSQSMPQFVSSFLTIVAVSISMLVLSVPLTLLAFLMVGVMQVVMRFILRHSGRYFSLQQKNLGIQNGFIEEMMEGMKVVKVFNHEDKVMESFIKINGELAESSYQANKFANILMPIVGNLGNLSYVLTASVGGFLAINGYIGLSIGGLASFLALNRSFTMPLSQVSQQLNAVIMAMAGAKRIFNLLDEAPEVDEGQVTLVNCQLEPLREATTNTGHWAWKQADGSLTLLRGDVRFEGVNFSYVSGNQILFDVDLYAKPGQKIAFVGATGAGKTTMTNLINRFYDVDNGRITYDGIPIKDIKKSDLRKSLGMVLQDTHLFSGSIADNIRYARPDASMEAVIEAAKLANAHGFIRHLEFGYDTLLTRDGASLSQGQRQLLSIARAALANPPVLILDEATSSIDSKTEALVQAGMDKLMAGRTTFVIAHRLSTIKNANAIMVMDKGRIIERGDHQDLLDAQGVYHQLYLGGQDD